MNINSKSKKRLIDTAIHYKSFSKSFLLLKNKHISILHRSILKPGGTENTSCEIKFSLIYI